MYKKGNISWIKGKKHSKKTKRKMSEAQKGEKNSNYGKKMSKKQKKKISLALTGRKCSKKTLKKMSLGHRNINLKNNAKKRAIHYWVIIRKGKASNYKCKCGKQAYHWANKKHDHKRNLDDYMALCRSCHRIYDLKNNST